MERSRAVSVIDRVHLPESYAGYKLNSVLAYTTPRFVSIEDRRLGCLYYFLVALVAMWVVGFQILYGNEHYKLWDVLGESRMSIQQPTKNGCNPRKSSFEDNVRARKELPYCEAYEGAAGTKLNHSSHCSYFDMVDLTPNGAGINSLFVPTRIDTTIQERGCKKGETELCSKMWKTSEVWENTFVAGIEDYTMLIRSSYKRKGIRGHSFSHVGHYYQCKNAEGKIIKTDPCEGTLTLERIKCHPNLKCPRDTETAPPLTKEGLLEIDSKVSLPNRRKSFLRRNSSQSLLQASGSHSDEPDPDIVANGVYAIPTGDVFTIRKLLELAGLDLDESKDGDDLPLRTRGTAISVSIEYTNMRPFGVVTNNMDVGYAYRVFEQPLDEVKEEIYSKRQPSGDPKSAARITENRHGLMISGKVTGSFGTFDIVYLLVMLTTSLALLGVAQKVVDFVALNTPSDHQEQYKNAKYDVHRLSDKRESMSSSSSHL